MYYFNKSSCLLPLRLQTTQEKGELNDPSLLFCLQFLGQNQENMKQLRSWEVCKIKIMSTSHLLWEMSKTCKSYKPDPSCLNLNVYRSCLLTWQTFGKLPTTLTRVYSRAGRYELPSTSILLADSWWKSILFFFSYGHPQHQNSKLWYNKNNTSFILQQCRGPLLFISLTL